MTDPPLPDELVDLVAARLAALGDPTRVRLLDTLRRAGEASVGELADATGAGYANAAKHLALLHRQRVLSRRKEGARVIYRICDPSVLGICELVCESLATQVRELEALVDAVSAGEPPPALAREAMSVTSEVTG